MYLVVNKLISRSELSEGGRMTLGSYSPGVSLAGFLRNVTSSSSIAHAPRIVAFFNEMRISSRFLGLPTMKMRANRLENCRTSHRRSCAAKGNMSAAGFTCFWMKLLLFTWLLSCHVLIAEAQRSGGSAPRPSSSPRGGSRYPGSTYRSREYFEWIANRVHCYTCSTDFTYDRLTENNTCIIPDDRSELTICSANAKFCKAEVTRINGVLLTFSRSCADSCAHKACYEKGYGLAKVTCTYCCGSEGPDCGERGARAVSLSPSPPPFPNRPGQYYT